MMLSKKVWKSLYLLPFFISSLLSGTWSRGFSKPGQPRGFSKTGHSKSITGHFQIINRTGYKIKVTASTLNSEFTDDSKAKTTTLNKDERITWNVRGPSRKAWKVPEIIIKNLAVQMFTPKRPRWGLKMKNRVLHIEPDGITELALWYNETKNTISGTVREYSKFEYKKNHPRDGVFDDYRKTYHIGSNEFYRQKTGGPDPRARKPVGMAWSLNRKQQWDLYIENKECGKKIKTLEKSLLELQKESTELKQKLKEQKQAAQQQEQAEKEQAAKKQAKTNTTGGSRGSRRSRGSRGGRTQTQQQTPTQQAKTNTTRGGRNRSRGDGSRGSRGGRTQTRRERR